VFFKLPDRAMLLLSPLFLLSVSLGLSYSRAETTVEVRNESGGDVDIYWVDSSNRASANLFLLSTLPMDQIQPFNSYANHQFVFSYHLQDELGNSRVQFTKGLEDEVVILSTEEDGRLVLKKKTIEKTAVSVSTAASRRGSGRGANVSSPSHGVRTRTTVTKKSENKISLQV
jgi:hypothetical protein